MPQPHFRQQSRSNEIQMLQRQIMFKQMQDLQRQKILQELNDATQHNLENQQSLIHSKLAPVARYSPFINGTPVRDASQMFMFGNTNLVQGFPNGLIYSQDQKQGPHSIGLASQQLDGTRISSNGHSFSQYSYFQVVSEEAASVLTKPNNKHADNISKSLIDDQFDVSSNQDTNLFGPVLTQGLDMGRQTGDIQQVNNDQRNASLQEFDGAQEQGGWHGHFSEITANVNPSQGLATLDPLEQKILFDLNDNSFGASLGEHGNTGTGGFENMFENTDHWSAFPSVQSGSWSALMQSAVAEASSNDTGLQEEWSGLSFQNPKPSNDNQPSNFVESGKHATLCLHNNFQNASSISPKPGLLNTSHASSSFPGFQYYPATQFQFPNTENMHSDCSHEPNHQSSKEANERLNCSAQHREPLEGSAPVQRLQCSAAGFPAPYSASQASHNMLELLHKVDRSRECRPGTESGYTDSVPTTDVPKANPADAFSPSYNNSPASHYFGLRLAPPTQRPPINYFDSSQISQQAGQSNKALQVPESDSNQHNQNSLTKHSPQATESHKGSRYPAFRPEASQGTFHLVPLKNKDGQQSSTFESRHSLTTLGMAQQIAFSMRPSNVWVDVPVQQNSSGMGSHKAPNGSPSTSDAANSRMETAFEPGAHVLNSQGFDYGRGHTSKIYLEEESHSGHPEVNASNLLVHGSHRVHQSGIETLSTSTRDLEAFESSLKQAHVPRPNYFLLNSMHSDPITRAAINNGRADSDINIPPVTSMSQLNSASKNHKDLPISSAVKRDQLVKSSSQPLQENCQDTVTYKKDGFHSQPTSNDMVANIIERSQINFPMAPLWFKNYGDANNAEQQLSVGRSPQSLHRNSSLVQVNLVGSGQYGSVWPATGTNSVAQLSSPYLQHLDMPNPNLVVLKSKKRKFPTFELLPWHKEATKGSSGLLDTSIAELEWAQAANRLPEKLKEEAEASGDSLRTAHPKKRLTLTTQLMQLLFRPAPAVILSYDATTHYDTMTYFAARLALGDACSLAVHSHTPHDSSPGKSITTKSISDQDLSKVVQDLIDRTKRLEDELLRLENGGLFLDTRVDFEELEKFSVINRFAKFHSRAQSVAAETAYSMPKLYPQRYVTASPMPSTIPEGQNCISL